MARAWSIGAPDEIHLEVRNLDRMRRVYEEILGCRPVFAHEGRMVGLDVGGAMLVLEASRRRAAGISLGFSCRDLPGALRRLRGHGVRLIEPVWEGHWGQRVARFKDPEGNVVVLEAPSRQGARRGHRHS